MRCSQPLCGQQGRRCKEDEKLLNTLAYKLEQKGIIFDTRSSSAINSHKSKGLKMFDVLFFVFFLTRRLLNDMRIFPFLEEGVACTKF